LQLGISRLNVGGDLVTALRPYFSLSQLFNVIVSVPTKDVPFTTARLQGFAPSVHLGLEGFRNVSINSSLFNFKLRSGSGEPPSQLCREVVFEVLTPLTVTGWLFTSTVLPT